MGGLVRLLIIAGAVYLISRGVRRLFRSPAPAGRQDPPTTGGTPLVQCAQCEQFIPEPEAIRALVSGKARTFCSPECRAGDRQRRHKPD